MAQVPDYAHIILGIVAPACFFFPGLKYYRQRRAGQAGLDFSPSPCHNATVIPLQVLPCPVRNRR